MIKKHGKYTGEFGNWLTKFIQKRAHLQGYSIFFDHGNSVDFENVGAIKGFFGKQVSNQNRLADIDVIIANEKDEAILLIEIEESAVSPKKILGDIYAILFCNHVAIRMGDEQKQFFITSRTRLVVAGVVPPIGYRHSKIHDVILPRMRQFSTPDDAIHLENISFVGGESIADLLVNLKEETKSLLRL